MRYAIGARVVENDGSITDGIYAFDEYGLSCLISCKTLKCKHRTFVFTDAKDAEKYAQHLSRTYRKEFLNRAKRHDLDISQFRFFVVKVDSSKFTRKLSNIAPATKITKYPSQKLYYIE